MGGATQTFFPLNILILPVMVPIMSLANPRFSEFALKIQYSLMMFLYCIFVLVAIVPAALALYLKAVINSVYLSLFRIREDYRG